MKMFWILVAIQVILLIVHIYIRCKRFFTYWSTLGVPQYQFWKIWYKTAVDVIQQPPLIEGMQRMYEDFKDNRYVGTYEFLQPRLCLRDPELIKRVTVKDFDHFTDHSSFIPLDDDPVTQHSLFILKGDSWKCLRATVSPAFTTSKMKILFQIMSHHSKEFFDHFVRDDDDDDADGIRTLEIKSVFSKLTNDVIVRTIFGIPIDSLKNPNNEFLCAANKITDFSSNKIRAKYVMLKLFPKLSKFLGITMVEKKISAFYKNVIRENIESRKANRIVRPDLINIFMEAKENGHIKNGITTEDIDEGFAVVNEPLMKPKNGQKYKHIVELNDDMIAALVMNFYGAGYDSISTMLSFMAYELATNVDVQQRLQEEIDRIRLRSKGTIAYRELFEMKYLDMVVTETLRKWPTGFFLERVCVKPYTIKPVRPDEGPIHLKEGNPVSIPLFAIMRDPQYFPNPDCFDPERFSDENKSKIDPYIYLPFGSGPRHCIGNRFALMEMKIVFYYLLSKFDLVVVDKTTVPLKVERRYFQLNSKGGFWLGLRKRIRSSK